MDTRFYQAQGLDVERIALDLEKLFVMQGYQVQQFGDKQYRTIQIKKGGDFEAFIGMQAALTLTLQATPNGVMAVLGQQQWVDKAALGTLGLLVLWPLALTAGAGVLRQSSLDYAVLNALDSIVFQQRPDVRVGPVPPHMMPDMQQPPTGFPPHASYPPQGQPQWTPPMSSAPPPSQQAPQRSPTNQPSTASPQRPMPGQAIPMPPASKVICANCEEINDIGDAYCARCGTALVQKKTTCTTCGAVLKTNAAFCTKCGTHR